MTAPPVPVMAAKAYGLTVRAWRQVRRVWRLETDRGVFALKRALPEPMASLLRAAETHLLAEGFNRFPRLVPTRAGTPEIILTTGERFILRAWLPGIPPTMDLDHPRDTQRLSKAVAEAHLASKGFHPEGGFSPEPTPGRFEADLSELKRFLESTEISKMNADHAASCGFDALMLSRQNRNSSRYFRNPGSMDSPSRFSRLYRQALPENIEEGALACRMLREADYGGLLHEVRTQGGLCHGDLAPNNSLIHGPEAYLLDMDRACVDVFPFDLAMLVRRAMAGGGWHPRLAMVLIEGYQRYRQLSRREMRVLAALLHWPQAFWRLGHQYFAEQLDRPERFFLSRLWHWESEVQARRAFLAFCRENLW